MGIALSYEINLSFVWNCLQEYWGRSRIFLLITVIGLIWLLVSGRQKNARVLLGGFLFLSLTVFNPFLTKYFVPKLVGRAFFYRLFWAFPAVLAAAFVLTEAVFRFRNRWLRAGTAALATAAIVSLCGINTDVTGGFHLPENVYKVPDALVFACDAIHEDYVDESGRHPKAVFTEWLSVYSRQYDPTIALTISRDEYLQYNGSPVNGVSENTKRYQRRKRILDVINSREDVSEGMFRIALRKTKTDYLVIPVEYYCHGYLLSAGLREIARNDEVVVYRFDRKKKS